MVAGSPVEDLHVHVAAYTRGEAVKKIVDQLTLQVAHLLHLQRQVDHGVGAAAEIDSRDGQRLVHRHDEVPGAIDAPSCAKRLRHRFPECNSQILDGVVLVYVKVPFGADVEIEGAMACHQVQHVIEKTDAGPDVVPAFSLNPHTHADLRFTRLSVDYGTAHSP